MTSSPSTDAPAEPAVASPEPLRADPEASTSWISWLRVAAIAGVVAIHSTGATAVAPGARDDLVGVVAIAINRGFNIAVPLFVLLSGALLLDPARYPGDGTFLRRRAWRLVPAIVFWHLFYWAFLVLVQDADIGPRTALVATLNGRLYTALYFFWIVLGLAVVAPVLVAWLRTATRRSAVIAGCAGTLIPVLTAATVRFRGAPVSWVETPWTWWIPYVGLFVLGWALRGIRVPAWVTAVCVVVPLGILGSLAWTFGREGVPSWYSPLFGGYYSPAIQLAAVLTFVAVSQLVRPDGPLRLLTGPRATRLGRTLGDATLGIFALHLAVLQVSYSVPGLAGDAVAQTLVELLGRLVIVLVATTALVLVGRRVPVVRRVL